MAGANGTSVGSVVTFAVTIGGNIIPNETRVLSVHIETQVNRISTAKIVILDGNADTGEFKASSSATFIPGAAVTISAGYDSNNTQLFQGIITRQSIRIDNLVGSALEVECRDSAIKMIVGRKSLTFSQQSDSDIITSIIGTYSLTANVVSTSAVWPEQVQYYVTDWDFILSRAEINGMIVTTHNGTVAVFAPDSNTTSVYTTGFGSGLIEFNADMDAITQLSSVTATAWDYQNQAVNTGQASNSYAGPGNLSSSTLAGVVGLADYQLQTSAPFQSADLTTWSKAQLVKSAYAKIQGEAKVLGTNAVSPGNYITLQGIGDRFSGDHIVSKVAHEFSDGNWMTGLSIGLSPTWFIEEPDVISPPASGLLPASRGLFSGTVMKIYDDPLTQYRILVSVPLFDANGAGIWARLANFYSTSNGGAFFLPEVGDEVVIGFLNEDPRSPVILGSVYSSSNLSPFTGLTPNQNNTLKAIVSKTGISIQFDDENKVLTIVTPDKNTLILSDKDKKITLQDDNQNSLVMSADGITIKSPKNINLQADGSISIAGTQGVTVAASGGDVGISGINIKETADSQYSAQGSQTAAINSGMELTLKSAMIMIN